LKKSGRVGSYARPAKHVFSIRVTFGGYVTNPNTKRKVDYACVVDKNTYISGASKAICCIHKGDKVVSQDGLEHKINEIYKYKLKEPFPVVTIKVPWRRGCRKHHHLMLTPNHRIPILRETLVKWVPIYSLREDDMVFTRRRIPHNKGIREIKICLNCGKKHRGQGKKFCSITCRNEYWYEKGHNPLIGTTRSKEARENISQALIKRLKENPELHPNRLMSDSNTLPEIKIKTWLEKMGTPYETQKYINGYYIDFFIPSMKLIIETDGIYWHQNQEKDIKRDKDILKGCPSYTIFHLRFGKDERYIKGFEWNPLPNSFYFGCNPSMESFVDLRYFEPTPLVAIEHETITPQTYQNIYDLNVDSVHSYVANGILISNSYVHDGTSKMPPRPFLLTAIMKHRESLAKAIKEDIKE